MGALKLYGLGSSRGQAERIGAALGVPLSPHEEREFEDGEHKARPLDSVDGADVCVVHSLHGEPGQSANDKLCRALFFAATVRDHGARSVTVVAPYLCYSRKDRRTQPNDPVLTRHVAQLFDASGVDAVLTLDVHNPAACENAFRGRFHSLETSGLFVPRLAEWLDASPVVVLAPDAGALKRADAVRTALSQQLQRPVGSGLMEKHRNGGTVSGERLFADVAGQQVVIVDDLISTGTTLLRAAQAARAAGARRVYAAVTHGLFIDPAAEALADPAIDRIVVSDSVPPFRLVKRSTQAKVDVLPCAGLVARQLSGRDAAR